MILDRHIECGKVGNSRFQRPTLGPMPPRLLLRILFRLEVSPLPPDDPVRLELDRELTALTTRLVSGVPRHVVRVHDDAQGDVDTMVQN